MKIFTLLFIILSNQLFSQDIKKIKVKLSSNEDELYYVLKSNPTQKHGTYEMFDRNKLKIKGQYKNGLKDSLWTEYSYSGKKIKEGSYLYDLKSGIWHEYSSDEILRAKGPYEKDTRTGIWDFFNSKGELFQQYNFKENKLIQVDTSSSVSRRFIRGGKFDGLNFVDYPAKYHLPEIELFNFIHTQIQYPIEAKSKKIEGRVVISFFVNETGELSDFKILRGIGGGCDEEAIRVLKLTAGNWDPALFENQKVNSEYIFPIQFKLK